PPPRAPPEYPREPPYDELEPRERACASRFMLLDPPRFDELDEFDELRQLPLSRDCQLPFEFCRDTLPLRSAYTLFGPLPTRFAFCVPASRFMLLGAWRARWPPCLKGLLDGNGEAWPLPPAPPAGSCDAPAPPPGLPAPPTPPTPPPPPAPPTPPTPPAPPT